MEFIEFADAAARERWHGQKGLTVFSAASPDHPTTEIDLFLEPPFAFDDAYGRAARFDVAPGVEATFVAAADLIAMKKAAGRPQDLQDIEGLQSLRREERGEP